jgi:hypothetical protein
MVKRSIKVNGANNLNMEGVLVFHLIPLIRARFLSTSSHTQNAFEETIFAYPLYREPKCLACLAHLLEVVSVMHSASGYAFLICISLCLSCWSQPYCRQNVNYEYLPILIFSVAFMVRNLVYVEADFDLLCFENNYNKYILQCFSFAAH